MPITVVCAICGKTYAADESLAGRRVRCRGCGNVVEIPLTDPSAGGMPGDLTDGPDLDALAHVERSFAGGDALSATRMPGATPGGPTGGLPPEPRLPAGMEDIPITGAGIEAAGRPNRRFDFRGARLLDELLPWGLVLASAAWFFAQTARNNDTDKPWITFTRIALPLLFYVALVWPVTFQLLRVAGRKIGFQLPRTARWRAFACYLPAMTLTAALWMMSGSVPAFAMGLLAGLLVSSGCLWILYRLTPDEIAPAAGYGAAGFAAGAIISGAALFGLNSVARSVVQSTESLSAVPSSPLGSGFAWVSEADFVRPGARLPAGGSRGSTARPDDVRAETGRPPADGGASAPVSPAPGSPTNDSPAAPVVADAPTPLPTPPPGLPPSEPEQPRSPLVAALLPAPLPAPAYDFVAPRQPSTFVAALDRDWDLHTVTLWNSSPWQRRGQIKFRSAGDANAPFHISPAGRWMARVVTFPKLSIEVTDFEEPTLLGLIDLTGKPDGAAPHLVGFLTADRILVRWDGAGAGVTVIEAYDLATSRRVRGPIPLPALAMANNLYAFSPAGDFVAVAANVGGTPSVLVYAMTGTSDQPSHTIRIGEMDPRWPVEPTGFAFVPDVDDADQNVLALMFEQAGGALIVAYRQTGQLIGRPLVYNAGPPASRPPGYAGSALQWLVSGDARWFLVYGSAVVDPATGATVGDLQIGDVERAFPVDAENLLLVTGPGGAGPTRKAVRVRLNLSSLKPTR